jgi:ADP-ribosylglycohydrolase
MLGAIAGDIIGSIYENFGTKRKDFRLFTPFSTFTDDTVLTVAVAHAILTSQPYAPVLKSYAKKYPLRGYGSKFLIWMSSAGLEPYNSFGNGSAMRVSPVAHAFETESEIFMQAQKTAECTHNHPEGIKGAQATAAAVFMAKNGFDREDIRKGIQKKFGYDLSSTVDEIRPYYKFDITCQGSVPQAIIAFLDSSSFEDAVRNAVSLGGDADTQAAIAGSIAEAYYKEIPHDILRQIRNRLTRELWYTTEEFYRKFGIKEISEELISL